MSSARQFHTRWHLPWIYYWTTRKINIYASCLSIFINSTKQSVANWGLSDLARETNSYSDWLSSGGPLAGPWPRRFVWVCRLETSPAPGTGTELNDAQPELILSSAGKYGFRIIRHSSAVVHQTSTGNIQDAERCWWCLDWSFLRCTLGHWA